MTHVCIVAPSYNHEAFIARCLESVIEQSPGDFTLDLIVVDDASHDASAAIAKRLLESPAARARLRESKVLVNSTNLGAHHSYNLALEMTDAELVHFLNTDDWLAPERIASVVRAFESSRQRRGDDIFWGFGRVSLVDEVDEPITGDGFWQYLTHVIDYSVAQMPSASFHLLRDNLSISTGNIFASRALATKVGGFGNYQYVHDWDFVLKCLVHTEPTLLRDPDSEYLYRHHRGNTFKKLGHLGHLESYEVLFRYFSDTFLWRPPNRATLSPSNYDATIVRAFFAENPVIGHVAQLIGALPPRD